MPKKDDELVIPTELLEKDPNELAQNESEIQTIISYLQKTRESHRLVYCWVDVARPSPTNS